MTPPLLTDFAPPVSYFATTAGIWTAVRVPTQLPTLDEVRTKRAQPRPCTCTDGTCMRCFLDDDAAFERSQDL